MVPLNSSIFRTTPRYKDDDKVSRVRFYRFGTFVCLISVFMVVMHSFYVLSSLCASSLAAVLFRRANESTVALTAPSSPPSDRQAIDASFQSYSIEFNYMLDYAGNNSFVSLLDLGPGFLTHCTGIRIHSPRRYFKILQTFQGFIL